MMRLPNVWIVCCLIAAVCGKAAEAPAQSPAPKPAGAVASAHAFGAPARFDLAPIAPAPAPLFPGWESRLPAGSEPDTLRSRVPWGWVIGGGIAGGLLGAAVLFSPKSCRSGDSMCGLALPLYAGGGAVAGGIIGYVVARTRH